MGASNLDSNEITSPVSVDTAVLTPTTVEPTVNTPDSLYPKGIPEPEGTTAQEKFEEKIGESTDPTSGTGVEGEDIVWEARYSMRRFIGRALTRTVLSLAWMVLAIYTWGAGHQNLTIVTWIGLGVVVILWLTFAYRLMQAHFGHFYQLSNRRLFVSSGIVVRRRDMMELLQVKDVFTEQQSLLDRWFKVGTVVAIPKEREIPTFYLTGVADPQQVMDLIWHHARSERDLRSVRVDEV